MKYRMFLAAVAALGLVACGQKSGNSNSQASQGQTYSGTGKVVSIAGDQVSIAHGPIAGIGWPAMTMTFTAPADLANAAKVGDEVSFSFRKDGSAYRLTSLQKH